MAKTEVSLKEHFYKFKKVFRRSPIVLGIWFTLYNKKVPLTKSQIASILDIDVKRIRQIVSQDKRKGLIDKSVEVMGSSFSPT